MDASKAASSVLTAVSEDELTPIEGTRVMGLIDSYRRTLELTEIEKRLQFMEQVQWINHFFQGCPEGIASEQGKLLSIGVDCIFLATNTFI